MQTCRLSLTCLLFLSIIPLLVLELSIGIFQLYITQNLFQAQHDFVKSVVIDSPHTIRNSNNGSDVIVYLAQFGHHSTYGNQTDGLHPITGLSKLNKSLELLYTNYVYDFPCDVIVLYGADDDPDLDVIQSLKKKRPQLQFKQLTGKWW